jgi:hypothetical protein
LNKQTRRLSLVGAFIVLIALSGFAVLSYTGNHNTTLIGSTSIASSGTNAVQIEFLAPIIHYVNISSASFPGYEEIPVSISTKAPGVYNLTAVEIPYGEWAGISPSLISIGSNLKGSSELIVAGGVEPLLPNPHNFTLEIQVSGPQNIKALSSVQLVGIYNVTSMASIQSIQFTNKCVVFQNGSSNCIFGSVYAPAHSQGELSVSFKVNGIMTNGTVTALPSTIEFGVPSPFALKAWEPFYSYFSVNAASAKPGTYHIQIEESINGTVFNQDFGLIVLPNGHL